jgi:exopolysaccharide biosynthesis polyprenyl glycosylphosphotransferase
MAARNGVRANGARVVDNGRKGAGRPHTTAIALLDFIGVNVAFGLAYVLRYRLEIGGAIEWYNAVPYRDYAPWASGLGLMLVVLFWIEGLYDRRRTRSWFATVYALATATVVGVALLTILIFGLRPAAQSRLMLPYVTVLIVAVLGLLRFGEVLVERRQWQRGRGVLRTLLVGAGETGRAVMRNVVAQPNLGYHLVGFLDDNPAKRAKVIGRFDPLGTSDDLVKVLAEQAVDMVIIALPWRSRDKIMRLVDQCETVGTSVRIVPDLFQMSLNRVDVDSLGGIPLIAVREPVIRGWPLRIKRAMDVAVAGLILVTLAPLASLIALAIKIDSPGPVHFRQTRVGRFGRRFTCYKFRSMHEGADAQQRALSHRNEATGPIFKIRDDPRLTRVGRVLRRLSFDELPQLWNVLFGDMSLVGPRPPMPDEVARYEDWHRRRLEVAPGLTGLWQVSGRSELTFDEMVMLDLYYAENWSLGLDLAIMLRTVPTVLRGTGAY